VHHRRPRDVVVGSVVADDGEYRIFKGLFEFYVETHPSVSLER